MVRRDHAGEDMSIQAVAWVLDHSQARGFARLVLISLANHADKETGECFPSMRSISREAGISLGSIPAKIRDLVEIGEVVIVDPGDARRSARYQLTFATQPALGTPVETADSVLGERSGDERTVQPMGRAQRSSGERSGAERTVQPRSERSVQPRSEQNHHQPSGEEEKEEPPLTPPSMLPAEGWARRWAELVGVTPTRSVLRGWVPKVQEFMDSGGEPTDELLAAAREAGIESPAAWAYAVPKVTRAKERRRIADWIKS